MLVEAGDSVKLYFPSNKEEEAVVINRVIGIRWSLSATTGQITD
ncbi:hypothetical protein [Clostridium thailandense]